MIKQKIMAVRTLLLSILVVHSICINAQTIQDTVYTMAPITQDQEIPTITDTSDIYMIVTEEPVFIEGGNAGYAKFIQKNLLYPVKCEKMGIEGIVYITAVIEKDGSLTNVRVLRGQACEELNTEALRVIKSLPRFTPAKNNGVPVRYQMRFPIKFELMDDE